MKTKILFVDEDPNVLHGLRRALHDMREEWEMTFCLGSKTAFENMEAEFFDVVVSGLSIPGMDDKAFLGKIREKYPETLRIVLSGQTNKESIAHLAGTAHQYLSKPCDPDMLISAIARSRSLKDVVQGHSIKRIISQIESLPSLPSLYFELMSELRSESASMKKIGEIISSDVGMTANVLKLVNSSYFGLPRHVASPTEAVILLGIETITSLVISAQTFSQFDPKKLGDFSIDNMVFHSLETGRFAKSLAVYEEFPLIQADHALIAGLLHDCGKLLLAANLPGEYRTILDMAANDRKSLVQAEQAVLNTTHAEIGGALLGIWGLPDGIIEAVALHHNPAKSPDNCLTPLTAVHVANAMWHDKNDLKDSLKDETLDRTYLAKIEMTDHLSSWQTICLN